MLNSMSADASKLGLLVRHPVFLIAIAGIAIRFVIFPFLEVGYDSDFWATIIGNIEAGEGLYGLEGYYYTPVWGYVLSFLSFIQESLLNIDVMGLRVPEAFPIEVAKGWYLSATVTSISFNVSVKTLLLIFDLIAGYLVYWLIKDKTGDMRKATIGFALWFLCPLVICITSVSGMFDSLSVIFTLLCIIMIRKDNLFLGGVLFSFAVLTKFFPAYLVFILIAYILVKHRGDGKALVSVFKMAAGAFLAFVVIMLPQIIQGDLAESFLFATTRATSEDGMISMAAVAYLAGIAAALILGYNLFKKNKEELDDSFFISILLMVAVLFLYPPLPQYTVLLIPFLVISITTVSTKLKWSWLMTSIGGAGIVFGSNLALLLSFGTFTGLISTEYIASVVCWLQTPIFTDLSPMSIFYSIPGTIQYAGIISVLLFFIIEERKRRKRGFPVWPFGLLNYQEEKQS
ncbi:MAG: EpsG family protein [Candidatus Methanoplasma sp.]|jgi:hypothetical protein|nr:EpsG family protein [Candidatus Methanoplasma sp.]